MNSGKTDAAAHLIRGLARAGYAVGAAKVTGTGAGQDIWLMTDAGANLVLDFTTAGHASTYLLEPTEVIRVFRTLVSHLAAQPIDAIVLEVADGVFQAETATLISSSAFLEHVTGVVFAAGDALGAVAGVARLRSLGLPVVAAGGCLTRSPCDTRGGADARSAGAQQIRAERAMRGRPAPPPLEDRSRRCLGGVSSARRCVLDTRRIRPHD
jgi:hypothetical protein